MTENFESAQSRYTPGEYGIDADRSSICFQGRSLWGLMPVRGRFKEFAGTGRWRDDGSVAGQLDIDVASLSTGIAKRDRHLVSPDFFDAERYPVITFTVADLRLLPSDNAAIEGNLQIKNVTEQVTLLAALAAPNSLAIQFNCRTTLDRNTFNISANQLGMVSANVVIDAHLRWTRCA